METDKKLVVYNITNLGSGMKDLGLHVCINDIWNKMIANRKKGIWTRFYIDEMHVLLRSESATMYLVEIWKRARKWYGIPTGITQNISDFLTNEESKKLITNTSFLLMMSLSAEERESISSLLGIPDNQMDYTENADCGHGLLYTGRTTIPFSNEFPKDTNIHELLSKNEKDK